MSFLFSWLLSPGEILLPPPPTPNATIRATEPITPEILLSVQLRPVPPKAPVDQDGNLVMPNPIQVKATNLITVESIGLVKLRSISNLAKPILPIETVCFHILLKPVHSEERESLIENARQKSAARVNRVRETEMRQMERNTEFRNELLQRTSRQSTI